MCIRMCAVRDGMGYGVASNFDPKRHGQSAFGDLLEGNSVRNGYSDTSKSTTFNGNSEFDSIN